MNRFLKNLPVPLKRMKKKGFFKMTDEEKAKTDLVKKRKSLLVKKRNEVLLIKRLDKEVKTMLESQKEIEELERQMKDSKENTEDGKI